jgi:hypothetical protein
LTCISIAIIFVSYKVQHKKNYMAEQGLKVTTSKKQYLSLLMKWDEKIPEGFLSQVLKEHPEVNANRINNVRYGKTIDLEFLKEIIRITVPQYSKGK